MPPFMGIGTGLTRAVRLGSSAKAFFYGISCDETDDYAAATAGSAFWSGDQARTLGFWFRETSGLGEGTLVGIGTGTSDRWSLSLRSNLQLRIHLGGWDHGAYVTVSNWSSTGWNLVLTKYEGSGHGVGDFYFSVNGSAFAAFTTQGGTGPPDPLLDCNKIVLNARLNDLGFAGKAKEITQVFAYGTAWTDEEAAAYYASGYEDVRRFKVGPVFYYQMRPGSGLAVRDESGNRNDAAFGIGSAAPTWTDAYRVLTAGGPT